MRIYDPPTGRFLSVDPLQIKYPELTPYQFASNSPIANIDLDGLEAVPSMLYELFKAAGITTASAKQIEYNVSERGPKVLRDGAYVLGGTATVIGSGGAVIPIVFGGITLAGGGTKAYFDFKGDSETASNIPTTATGTVLVTANYAVGGKVFSEKFVSVAEYTEGVVTLNLQNFNAMNSIEKAVTGISTINLAIDTKDASKNFKALFSNVANTNASRSTTKPDALYVAPKLIKTAKLKSENNKPKANSNTKKKDTSIKTN